MKFSSIKFKITVLYVLILGGILIIYRGALFISLYRSLYSHVDATLQLKAEEIAFAISSGLSAEKADADALVSAVKGVTPRIELLKNSQDDAAQAASYPANDELYVCVLDSAGRLIYVTENIPEQIKAVFYKSNWQRNQIYNLHHQNHALRFIRRTVSRGGDGAYILFAGVDIERIHNLLTSRLKQNLIGLSIVLVLASLIGRLFIIRILNPVMDIAITARGISYKDLRRRLKTERMDEEMRFLADSFNDMLGRLENSFQYMSDFTAYATHELKTPLAIIRGEAELALERDRSVKEYKSAMEEVLAEAERMLVTIDQLLLLTRLEFKKDAFKSEEFELTEFLGEICEQAKLLAAKKKITVNCSFPAGPLYIKGDKLTLRRLFFNILDNAMKFNSEGGRIDLKLELSGNDAHILIADTGRGIPQEELPNLFRKFYRTRQPQAKEIPGSGLGLSICQSIAKAHGGQVTVSSRYGEGSVFTVKLPLP